MDMTASGLSGLILSLNGSLHDASYCVVHQGRVLLHVEAERYTRRKYESLNALALFLDQVRFDERRVQPWDEPLGALVLVPDDRLMRPVTELVQKKIVQIAPGLAELRLLPELGAQQASAYFDQVAVTDPVFSVPAVKRKYVRRLLLLVAHVRRHGSRLLLVGHHVAHVANAFFSSPYDRARLWSEDGGGIDLLDPGGLLPNYGCTGRGDGLDVLDLVAQPEQSLGLMWHRITVELLGKTPGSEGTVMAMAALGRADSRIEQLLLAASLDRPPCEVVPDAVRSAWASLVELARTQAADIAATLQTLSERQLLGQAGHLAREPLPLCVAGGVFLNCQALGRIQAQWPLRGQVYVPPAPYDGGLSIGAAQMVSHAMFREPRAYLPGTANGAPDYSPYGFGPANSLVQVLGAARSFGYEVRRLDLAQVFRALEAGAVSAVFAGASESGRRALGNRSVIADPRVRGVRDYINQRIKHREYFRPVAPAILAEAKSEWFPDLHADSPYMSVAVCPRPDKADQIAEALHLDGTARVQTVHRGLHGPFYEFMRAWARHSGIPILINTSFNDNEPIVQSGFDAVKCFASLPLGHLCFLDHDLMIANPSSARIGTV